jgi:drug/metabolite transporter (DMT)-like permease
LSHRAKVWTALWTVYLVWGSTYLAIAIAVETLPPLLAVATRFILAGAIMAGIVFVRGGSMRAPWPAIASCVLIGCLLPGANAVLFFAERDTPIGLASLIIASVPLWVIVLRLASGERLRGTAVGAVVLGFAGVAVLLRPSGGATTVGVALCVLSALMWSVGTVLSQWLPQPKQPFTATAYEMLGGGFAMLPLGLATAGSWSPTWDSAIAWLYLVTIGSVVGYTAYVWLLAHAPLNTTATYAYVNPVVAIVLGIAFRGEHLTWQILIGAAVIVASVAIVVREEAQAATQPEEGVR